MRFLCVLLLLSIGLRTSAAYAKDLDAAGAAGRNGEAAYRFSRGVAVAGSALCGVATATGSLAALSAAPGMASEVGVSLGRGGSGAAAGVGLLGCGLLHGGSQAGARVLTIRGGPFGRRGVYAAWGFGLLAVGVAGHGFAVWVDNDWARTGLQVLGTVGLAGSMAIGIAQYGDNQARYVSITTTSRRGGMAVAPVFDGRTFGIRGTF